MAKGESKGARLKRGELEVFTVEFSKEELAATPPAHRSFYLLLGQFTNEVAMLQSLLIRSLRGVRGPRPAQETALGMALFLTRALCGRIVEAQDAINTKENGKLLDEVWTALPDTVLAREVRASAQAARKRLNKALGADSSLMLLVRNKLAYHLDQGVLARTFDAMPADIALADFHTGKHGTTFYGTSDTVTAVAVAELVGAPNPISGVQMMADAAIKAVADLHDFADGFQLAFYLTHFGPERLRGGKRTLLRDLPEAATAALGFYLASTKGLPKRQGVDALQSRTAEREPVGARPIKSAS